MSQARRLSFKGDEMTDFIRGPATEDAGKILRAKDWLSRVEIDANGHEIHSDALKGMRRVEHGDLCIVTNSTKFYLIMLNITQDFYFDIHYTSLYDTFENIEE